MRRRWRMHPTISYLLGLVPAGLVLVLLILHYERQLKIMRGQRDDTQRNLNDALSRLMAVDYVSLRETEIRANADAQIAWSKATMTFEDQLIQDPTEVEIPHAQPTR
jgi:hypothetical protein